MEVKFGDYMWFCPVCKKGRRTKRAHGHVRHVVCCGKGYKITTSIRAYTAYEQIIESVEEIQ